MCAAGVRRSVPDRPVPSYRVPNRRSSGWLHRAANDNPVPHVAPYKFALLLTGTALVGSLALLAALSQA